MGRVKYPDQGNGYRFCSLSSMVRKMGFACYKCPFMNVNTNSFYKYELQQGVYKCKHKQGFCKIAIV